MNIKDVYNDLDERLIPFVVEYKYVPHKLSSRSKCEVGKRYWSGYYGKVYKVLHVDKDKTTVKWEDGKVEDIFIKLPDIKRDYELKKFNEGDKYKIVNGKHSYTAGTIKAMLYNGVFSENISEALMSQYFISNDHTPNDHNYYYLRFHTSEDGTTKTRLKRDMNKNPHNFYNIKTLGDVHKDSRIFIADFCYKDGTEIGELNPPEDTNVLEVKYISGARYQIILDIEPNKGE